MTKQETLTLINEHKDSYPQIIKAHHKEFYNEIFNKYIGEKFGEKLYRWIYENEDFGKCLNCGKETRFQSFIVGFTKYCSKKCSNISSADVRAEKLTHKIPDPKFWDEKECLFCKNKFSSLISRNQIFCSNNCSSNSTANDESRLNKIRKTKFENYGNETFVNSEKARQTCLEKYGVENASKSPEVKEKIKQTNLKKYGVEWSWQNKVVKDKIKNTCLKKYGTEFASSSDVVKEKRSQSCLIKYGKENIFQTKDTAEKTIKSMIEKYGVRYSSQNKKILSQSLNTRRLTTFNRLKIKYENLVEFIFDETDFKGVKENIIYHLKCKLCNNDFDDHMDGNGHPRCPICFPSISGFSIAENEILEYIKSLLPECDVLERNRQILDNGEELDIYIPSKNIAIEYNGLYWHSELGGLKNRFYHLNKTKLCEEKNIQLIHIFEDEWKNKKDIIKSKLKHILGCNRDRLFARKCEIKEIERIESNEFLKKYHIQGEENSSSFRIGLFHNNELVAVMTIGKLRLALGNKEIPDDIYELYRFSSSKSVIGAASKLFFYFVKTYNPIKVISYADRRYTSKKRVNLYEKIGFQLKGESNPNYWYFKYGYPIKYHRFAFRRNIQKDKLKYYDDHFSEWQNMQLNGYDRIWDCGHLKYEMSFKK